MTRSVTDLSPGTVLVSGPEQNQYTVEREQRDAVVLDGPDGLVRIGRDDLQRGVARGTVGVRS